MTPYSIHNSLASYIVPLNVISGLIALYIWFLYYKTITKRNTFLFLSVIFMLILALETIIIFHSYYNSPALGRVISVIAVTTLFLVLLINLRLLDVFKSIQNAVESHSSEKTQKILLIAFSCTFIILWLDFIPVGYIIMVTIQRLLAVIWLAASVIYDSFQSMYLWILVRKASKDKNKQSLHKAMQLNVFMIFVDWVYIILFVLGQFVYSFDVVGNDLRQLATAVTGYHVAGKTYVFYLLLKMLMKPKGKLNAMPVPKTPDTLIT